MNTFFKAVLLGASLALAGCVSTPMDELEHEPILMITQNSDGVVSLSWESEPGYEYKLYSIDRGETEWKPMNRTFKGTGATISLADKVNPRKSDRRYWIQADKIDP
jgi:hypothetical protein